MDTLGNVEWTKQIFSGKDITSNSFVIDEDDFIISGSFKESLIIDSDTTIVYDTLRDMFVMKLNEWGNMIWIDHYAVGSDPIPDIQLDYNKNILITGNLYGNITIGNFTVSSNTTHDQFFARLSTDGVCLGIENFGKVSGWNKIISDLNNDLLIVGHYKDSLVIDDQTINNTGYQSFFIAKHDSTINQIEEPTKSTTSNELIIIPNPNDGTCRIQFPAEVNPLKEAMLYIYDSEGRMLEEIPVLKNQPAAKIELDYLAKGLYLAKLVQGTKSYNGKIVFQ